MATMRRWGAGAERGTALITALIMLTVMGMFLFAFQTMNQSELVFAGYSRASTLALSVAEAGVQEGIKRLNVFGAIPGTTCFVNSMTSGATCATGTNPTSNPNPNTVAFQAAFNNNPNVFPILSIATTNGATRAVRILEQAVFKAGFSTVIFGPQITFQGDTSPTTGDTYSGSSLKFQTYSKSPQPAAGATATNLTSPQVMAGTWINTQGAGPGLFPVECTNGSMTDVAPTNCARGSNPINWHPATPVGMPSADFQAVVAQCYPAACSLGGGDTVSVPQAQQTLPNMSIQPATYPSPVSYTPSYWSSTGSGKVMLVVATTAFCVRASPADVKPLAGGCSPGYNAYGVTNLNPGNCTTTSPAVSTCTRYLDWGLISDDLNRATASTFYQPSTCTTCSGGNPNGNQNGIRYIPIVPTINALSLACTANMPAPGFSAFYNTTADGLTCPSPTQAGSGTFTGTKSSPEFLVIDDGLPGGTQVTLGSSGTATGCSDNFASANWGVIVATGDLNLQNFTFNGFIYTQGNVFSHGHVLVRGGIFSSQSSQNQIDNLGTLQFCGGAAVVPLTPQFFTFSTMTWQDRAAGQP